jgi:hypothetical protein
VDPDALRGSWRVIRRSGLIPPFGVTKRIGTRSGCTRLFGLPVACFDVRGSDLRYRCLPVVDRLSARRDGTWEGTGVVLGVPFCRFRLVPTGRR